MTLAARGLGERISVEDGDVYVENFLWKFYEAIGYPSRLRVATIYEQIDYFIIRVTEGVFLLVRDVLGGISVGTLVRSESPKIK